MDCERTFFYHALLTRASRDGAKKPLGEWTVNEHFLPRIADTCFKGGSRAHGGLGRGGDQRHAEAATTGLAAAGGGLKRPLGGDAPTKPVSMWDPRFHATSMHGKKLCPHVQKGEKGCKMKLPCAHKMLHKCSLLLHNGQPCGLAHPAQACTNPDTPYARAKRGL